MTDSATFTTPEAGDEDLGDLLLEVLPGDGSTMGNQSAREALSRAADRPISEEEYEEVKERALNLGLVVKGRGRGGTLKLNEKIINEYNKRTRVGGPLTEDSEEENIEEELHQGKLTQSARKQRYNQEFLDYLTDTCCTLASLQKTLRFYPEFLREENQALDLCISLQKKIDEHLDEVNQNKLNYMFYG